MTLWNTTKRVVENGEIVFITCEVDMIQPYLTNAILRDPGRFVTPITTHRILSINLIPFHPEYAAQTIRHRP